MAKNKGKMASERTTDVVVQPDQFQSGAGRVVERLKPHATRLLALGVALAIALVGYAVWRWNGARKDTQATSLYHRALLIGEVPLAEADAPTGDDAPLPDELRKLPASFPDAKARAEATLVVLEELARDHGGSRAAHEARLVQAGVLLDLGRADEAAALFRAYAADNPGSELGLAAREGYGYALEAKVAADKDAAARQAGLEAALAAFEAMQPKADAAGRARALYHQGRLLAALARPADARAKLDEALTQKPDPGLKADIETRLQGLAGSPADGAK